METLISSLPGSVTHQLGVEVYLRHDDAGTSTCALCGHQTPCPARRHAMSVIAAAGEDPRQYDPRASASSGRNAGSRPVEDGQRFEQMARDGGLPTNITGYALGGVGRRADVPYHEYER
jgi:hypothetical protein